MNEFFIEEYIVDTVRMARYQDISKYRKIDFDFYWFKTRHNSADKCENF